VLQAGSETPLYGGGLLSINKFNTHTVKKVKKEMMDVPIYV
jgi:hypothetical protein